MILNINPLVLGTDCVPPGMVVDTIEVGSVARIPLVRCQLTGKLLDILQNFLVFWVPDLACVVKVWLNHTEVQLLQGISGLAEP